MSAGKRVLIINNESPSYSGIVPGGTLAGISGDFNHVKNLAEQVREISGYGVKEIPYRDLKLWEVDDYRPDYIIAGGHCSMDGWGDTDYLKNEYAAECTLIRSVKVPYLGICAGHQFICMEYGFRVLPMGNGRKSVLEYGPADVSVRESDPLFKGLSNPFRVMMYHSWEARGHHPELKTLGSTALCVNAVVRHAERPLYGVQFHPEMLGNPHVQAGKTLLKNFFSLN